MVYRNVYLIAISMISLLTAQTGWAQETAKPAETLQPPSPITPNPSAKATLPVKQAGSEEVSQKQETNSNPTLLVDKRKKDDAAVDRNFILPSAETMARGELAFNSYQLFLAGLTYGFTDKAQLSLTTMLPIVEDIPLVLLAGFKVQVVRKNRFIFSIQPALSLVNEDGTTGGTLSVSFLLDFILDDAGKAVISIAEMNSFLWGGSSGDIDLLDDALLVLFSAGFNYRVHKYVKLMFEFLFVGGLVDGDAEIVEEATLFNYGVRFCGQTISVDLSFLRPLDSDVADDFVMGIPYVAFSARF